MRRGTDGGEVRIERGSSFAEATADRQADGTAEMFVVWRLSCQECDGVARVKP